MRGFMLNEWTLGMTLLTGAWVSVAVAMAGMMPSSPPTSDQRLTLENAQMWRSTHTLRVFGTNPCTGTVIVLDVLLTLDVAAHMEGEDAQVLVVAGLAGAPSPTAPDDIVAATSQFGFFAPLYGQRAHVHDLRTQLVGQPIPAELVIGVEQGVDGAGRLIVVPGAMRIVCT
jgi:hypothetical protein